MSTDLSPATGHRLRPKAEALMQAFLATKEDKPQTLDAYTRDLRSWLNFCYARDIDPLDAWPAHTQTWLVELAKGDPAIGRKPEAGTTRDRRLGAVSAWYRWLIRHQAAPRNAAALLPEERPKREPRKAAALSAEHAQMLVAAAVGDSPRAAAIVALLIYTGMRSAELIGASTSDLEIIDGEMVLHVHGKGGKPREARLNGFVLDLLNAYRASRADVDLRPVLANEAGAGRDKVPLIATKTGGRLDRKAIRLLLIRLAKKAGLPPLVVANIRPHGTRATYATRSIAAGYDLRAVQLTMGHARPETTAGYDRSTVTPDRDPALKLLDIIKPPTRSE